MGIGLGTHLVVIRIRAVHRNRIHTVIRVLYMGTRTVPSALKGTYVMAVDLLPEF